MLKLLAHSSRRVCGTQEKRSAGIWLRMTGRYCHLQICVCDRTLSVCVCEGQGLLTVCQDIYTDVNEGRFLCKYLSVGRRVCLVSVVRHEG